MTGRNWEAHVHHLTYERVGHEWLGDVIVLCLNCHNAEHPRHEFVDRHTQECRAKSNGRRNKKRRTDEKRRARMALKRVERKEKRLRREFGARD